jgi:hypothetical protein
MAQPMSRSPGVERTPWQRRIVTALLFGGAIVVLGLIGAAIIPRWWAHRITDVTDGRLTVGGLFGFFIGFVFTVLPLLAIWVGFRFRSARRTWKGWVAWLTVAAILALPNLMTLGIVWGTGDAASDGRQELNTDGNGFRMWSLIGAVVGAVAVLALLYLVRTRGWFRDDNRRLRNAAVDRGSE